MRRPNNRQYFPNRLPVGAYMIEPRVIKKAPNCTDRNKSKQTIVTNVRISFNIELHHPNRHVWKLEPQG